MGGREGERERDRTENARMRRRVRSIRSFNCQPSSFSFALPPAKYISTIVTSCVCVCVSSYLSCDSILGKEQVNGSLRLFREMRDREKERERWREGGRAKTTTVCGSRRSRRLWRRRPPRRKEENFVGGVGDDEERFSELYLFSFRNPHLCLHILWVLHHLLRRYIFYSGEFESSFFN